MMARGMCACGVVLLFKELRAFGRARSRLRGLEAEFGFSRAWRLPLVFLGAAGPSGISVLIRLLFSMLEMMTALYHTTL